MRRSVGWVVGCFLSVLASGCGGGGESTSGTTTSSPTYKYATEESFCQAVAEAECNTAVVTACYGSDMASLPDDTTACVTAREKSCNPTFLPYHPEEAEGCVSARAAALSDAVWTKDDLAAVEEACLPVFSKKQGDGAVCSAGTDCDAASGLSCLVKLGSLQGVCGAPTVVAGGESCAAPTATCDAGFYCDPKVSHCLANPKENEVCSSGAPCASDFYCTDTDAGTCTLKTKNGLDCTSDALCAGGFCVGATAAAPGKCSSTLPLTITSTSCDTYRM
jgi:hypothetical protein